MPKNYPVLGICPLCGEPVHNRHALILPRTNPKMDGDIVHGACYRKLPANKKPQ